MAHRLHRFLLRCGCFGWIILLTLPACSSQTQRVALARERDELRIEKEGLERLSLEQGGTIADLKQQIVTLQELGPGRSVILFAPVRLEIAGLSGGADYDNQRGDDGVTVYLRLWDADGDAVKAPGRITVQLLDNDDLASPRVLGVYKFVELEQLRQLWHGRFGTQHFTLRCPFSPDVKLPETRRITVSAEFVDFLSGATLTAVRVVSFAVQRD